MQAGWRAGAPDAGGSSARASWQTARRTSARRMKRWPNMILFWGFSELSPSWAIESEAKMNEVPETRLYKNLMGDERGARETCKFASTRVKTSTNVLQLAPFFVDGFSCGVSKVSFLFSFILASPFSLPRFLTLLFCFVESRPLIFAPFFKFVSKSNNFVCLFCKFSQMLLKKTLKQTKSEW